METAKKILKDFFASKSFSVFLAVFLFATAFVALGKLAGETWAGLMQWLIPSCVLHSAAENFSGKVKDAEKNITVAVADKSDSDLANAAVAVSDEKQ